MDLADSGNKLYIYLHVEKLNFFSKKKLPNSRRDPSTSYQARILTTELPSMLNKLKIFVHIFAR